MKKGRILMTLGLLLLLSALGLTVYNIYDEQRAGTKAADALSVLQAQLPTESNERKEQASTQLPPAYVLDPQIEMPKRKVGDDTYVGILTVPSLGLELPILSECSDAALRISPARFYGSVYTSDIVIAGHNYNTHFGKLPELPIGEIVHFTDMDGNVFAYELIEILVLGANDAELLCTGDWDMTLFTCTWGGAERITLRFAKI